MCSILVMFLGTFSQLTVACVSKTMCHKLTHGFLPLVMDRKLSLLFNSLLNQKKNVRGSHLIPTMLCTRNRQGAMWIHPTKV